jgi:hypothetical protein
VIPEILFNKKKKKKKNNEPNLFSIILGNEILDTKVYFGTYKMENKIHIVGTIPKSISKPQKEAQSTSLTAHFPSLVHALE